MSFTPLPNTITAITKANPAVVTTLTNHNYPTGEVVRLIIPIAYGMQELNKTTAIITILSANTFSLQSSQIPAQLNIDSTNFQAFTNAGTGTPAQVIPIGSGPTQSTMPVNFSSPLVGDSTVNDQLANISTTPIPF